MDELNDEWFHDGVKASWRRALGLARGVRMKQFLPGHETLTPKCLLGHSCESESAEEDVGVTGFPRPGVRGLCLLSQRAPGRAMVRDPFGSISQIAQWVTSPEHRLSVLPVALSASWS